MQELWISGGAPLQGEVPVSGAKNSVLPILAACTLCRGTCVLHNCPDITDVETSCEILRALGARVLRTGRTLVVDTKALTRTAVPAALAARMRSSVLFAGALLAAHGAAEVPLPGGCPLGKRPIDYHLQAFEKLGASCVEAEGCYQIAWNTPRGARIAFPRISVGATENAILAALGCSGETVLQNAAIEPEITDMVNFLRSAGAAIEDVGTRELRILGGERLHGTTYTVMPDRIETATFLCAAAGCGGEIRLQRTQAALLPELTRLLQRAGCELREEHDAVVLRRSAPLRAVGDVETAAYPGFATDCQALFSAAMLRAQGDSRITETLFENRFHHVPEMQKLGAEIFVRGRAAVIRGAAALHGAGLAAYDLRGGAALVLAALQAEGESTVAGVEHIDRGYERFAEKLRALGAQVERTTAG